MNYNIKGNHWKAKKSRLLRLLIRGSLVQVQQGEQSHPKDGFVYFVTLNKKLN